MRHMDDPPIAVTGSTGRLGGRIARLFADSQVPMRLVVREAARAPDLPGAEVAVAEYADRDAARAALAGTAVLLMVSASEAADRAAQQRTFVEAAAAAGVEHLVYVSFINAAPDATFTFARDHWATEEALRASGMAWTSLRASLFLDIVPFIFDAEGVVRGPAGDGRISGVAQDDIAEAAVAVLRSPGGHAGTTYTLTGPEAFTLDEAAAVMTEATGRRHRYQRETVEEAYPSRASYGAPDWEVEGWVSTYVAIANGEMATLTDDVRRLTGHTPRSLREVVTG